MSDRGRSTSPRPIRGGDMDVDSNSSSQGNKDAKVVVVNNLTRNVVESHLRTIFGFYGQISKVDLPLYGKSGQNRGKAALEFAEAGQAQKAVVHMNGGQLDGAILKVELSALPIYHRSRSHSRSPRSVSRSRSRSRSRTKSRSPPRRNGRARPRSYSRSRSPLPAYRKRGGRGGRGGYGRRGAPRDIYRPVRSRSRSRSRSPLRRANDRLGPRRRSPSYTRGGYGRGRSLTRSRSRSHSVRSSRSRTRSFSRSRSRSRSMSYSSYSRYSRSRSRSMSVSRRRRSPSRDDIRDSRSRSPT